MTVQETLDYARKHTSCTYDDIALGAGINHRNNAQRSLKAKNLRATTFVRLLNAMGFQLYLEDKTGKRVVIGNDNANTSGVEKQSHEGVIESDNKVNALLSKEITTLDDLLS